MRGPLMLSLSRGHGELTDPSLTYMTATARHGASANTTTTPTDCGRRLQTRPTHLMC